MLDITIRETMSVMVRNIKHDSARYSARHFVWGYVDAYNKFRDESEHFLSENLKWYKLGRELASDGRSHAAQLAELFTLLALLASPSEIVRRSVNEDR